MPIFQAGSLNTTALVTPDLIVQIVPPQNLLLNGVPTNVIGMIGTATWGPVNQPTITATMADYAAAFGQIQNRTFDLGTSVAIAVQQGAQSFRLVRVTDGTDTAASGDVGGATALALTARYTGSLGNSITVKLATGSAAGSYKLSVSLPGQIAEIYDNLTGTGNAFWTSAAAAINAGNGVLRGPSQIVTATAGASTSAPVAGTVALAGGTDGAAVTTSELIGSDSARTGIYTLRNSGVSVGMVCDLTDMTVANTLAGFALAEGIYWIAALPAGTTVAGAVAAKQSAGLDCYGVKLMHGDWLYWQDTVNGVLRLVSPQAFAAGRLANLSPQMSSLNKPLYSISGSQRSGLPGSGTRNTYSSAELDVLIGAGIDLITNPVPGGNYWGVRAGHNTSSDPRRSGDNYTRMTNYLASTYNAGMGQFIGDLINDDLFDQITATLNSFNQTLLQQGLLGTLGGQLPWSVVCNLTNNPATRTGLGYVQADVQVRYQAINEHFIINLEGGQTVTVARQTSVNA